MERDTDIIVQENRLVPCITCGCSGVEWIMDVTSAQWPQEMDHIMLRTWEEQVCSICHGSGYQGIQRVEVMMAFTEDHNDGEYERLINHGGGYE